MNNTEFVSALNEYSFSGENDKILKILNALFDSGEYKAYLNLVFNAISLTQMYGFLAYLDTNERAAFLSWDKVRSDSYVGNVMPYYNSGQLSLLLELEKHQKIFLSAPTSFGKTSLLLEFIIQHHKSLANVLIIVPTNSLLEELYIKLIDNNRAFEMNYCISTQPYFRQGLRNFLIVTPERFLLLYEGCDLSSFDIIIMDETYKIVDSKNEHISDFIEARSVRFRKVADMIGQTNNRLILLSPFTYELTDSMGRYLTRHGIKKIDRSIGKVYCITSEVYEKVTQLQREAQIRLENYNYCTQGHKRIDYEIDMIEDEYLSEAEREEKSKTLEEMLALGLTADDMRLSLNVSTKWKVALYKYFRLHPEQVTTSYEKAKDILEAQPKARIESLNYIFHILKAAFEAANIDGFECEPYEIRAFDSQNNFIWGRLYRVYCSGKIANVISSNRKYITGRYEDFIKEHNLTRIKEKRVMQQYFNEEKLGWILRYYKSDLTPNIDAFYSETFKFISSIIQYKIPFYTSFFVSILKLFLQKNALDASLDLSCLDAKKITLLFEDGSVYDDYSKLIDYGVSNDLVMKLHDGHITIAELQEERYDKSIFDEYEQLMLSDFLSIL